MINRTRSRRTSARSRDRKVGVRANAQDGMRFGFGAQNEWSAESPPIRSTSGPSPCACSIDSPRSYTGVLRSNSGSPQYSVERPNHEPGTGVLSAFAGIVRVAWGSDPAAAAAGADRGARCAVVVRNVA